MYHAKKERLPDEVFGARTVYRTWLKDRFVLCQRTGDRGKFKRDLLSVIPHHAFSWLPIRFNDLSTGKETAFSPTPASQGASTSQPGSSYKRPRLEGASVEQRSDAQLLNDPALKFEAKEKAEIEALRRKKEALEAQIRDIDKRRQEIVIAEERRRLVRAHLIELDKYQKKTGLIDTTSAGVPIQVAANLVCVSGVAKPLAPKELELLTVLNEPDYTPEKEQLFNSLQTQFVRQKVEYEDRQRRKKLIRDLLWKRPALTFTPEQIQHDWKVILQDGHLRELCDRTAVKLNNYESKEFLAQVTTNIHELNLRRVTRHLVKLKEECPAENWDELKNAFENLNLISLGFPTWESQLHQEPGYPTPDVSAENLVIDEDQQEIEIDEEAALADPQLSSQPIAVVPPVVRGVETDAYGDELDYEADEPEPSSTN